MNNSNQNSLEVEGWSFKYIDGKILNSLQIEEYTKLLGTNLPEMTFTSELTISFNNGFSLNFNFKDCLKELEECTKSKVYYAKAWAESRPNDKGVELDFSPQKARKDKFWTFETIYTGTIKSPKLVTRDVMLKLDYEKLLKKDKILFYKEFVMYEDELSDNGISIVKAKVRVMENNGFFVLLTGYTRLDNVFIRLLETRYQLVFNNNYVAKETILYKDSTYESFKNADLTKINEDLSYVKELLKSNKNTVVETKIEKIVI